MPISRNGPSAQTIAALSEAPSSTTAISSRVLALKPMPARQSRPGRPEGAHRDADQDRDDEGFEIALADERDLDPFHQHGDRRHRDAKQDAGQVRLESAITETRTGVGGRGQPNVPVPEHRFQPLVIDRRL